MLPGSPVKVFFREVIASDINSYYGESNNNPRAGGGQRDLRLRPAKFFFGALGPFFPERKNRRERTGVIYSVNAAGVVEDEKISLWDETPSRPNECRIAQIYGITGWAYPNTTRAQYLRLNEIEKVFWFLILDDNARVWASKTTLANLQGDEMDETVKEHIQNALDENHSPATGIIDLT